MDEAADIQRFVLLETLRLAVPMHMVEMRHWSPAALSAVAGDSAETVGSHGDALQFGGKHCAEAFNALARGLASTALTAWGGVTWQGLHWCTVPDCVGPDGDHPNPFPELVKPAPAPRPIFDLHLPDPEAA
ncbi:hypothetical protein [Streptomyces odontomachi]|uniref:hypothetical protein n=1 Tax=Streptomyces odontomachi TaxID=2944940 RepID=UPI00210B58B1|nr:hypothetical protein [Streptomyces sp. ODS25]